MLIYRSTVHALHNFVRTHKGNYGIRTPIVVRGFLADGRFVSWSRSVVRTYIYMRIIHGGQEIAEGVALGDCDAASGGSDTACGGLKFVRWPGKVDVRMERCGCGGASKLVRCCCWDVMRGCSVRTVEWDDGQV